MHLEYWKRETVRNRKCDPLELKEGFVITDSEYNILFENCPYDVFRKGSGSSGLSDELMAVIEGSDSATGIIERGDRSYYVQVSEITDNEKSFYIILIRDDTRRAKTEKKLSYCLEILNSINEGVIMTDRNGRIIFYNKKLGEYEDLDPKDVIGRRLMDVYQWSMESSEHYQVLKTGEPIREGNYRTVTKRGKTKQLIASSFPIKSGNVTEAVYSISRDMTPIRDVYSKTIGLQATSEKHSLGLHNGTRFTFDHLICLSSKMKNLIFDAQKAAVGDAPVLVYGETGTGKEMVVQGMHNAGPRSKEPFVALNCAALPESLLESLLFGTKKGAFTGAENTLGFFEQAGSGTLYLDEINSMPINLQAKFLRAVQEKRFRKLGDDKELPVRCKIVSSVNMDPIKCVENGQLRKDLYYRISVISLEVPPLRKRREDILPLVEYFEEKYCGIYGNKNIVIDDDLKQLLNNYDWPGNVRELEHIIESAVSLLNDNEVMTIYNIPQYLRKKLFVNNYMPPDQEGQTLNEILTGVEKKAVSEALEKNGMNITQAAKALGISRQNMQYRIEKLGLRELLETYRADE